MLLPGLSRTLFAPCSLLCTADSCHLPSACLIRPEGIKGSSQLLTADEQHTHTSATAKRKHSRHMNQSLSAYPASGRGGDHSEEAACHCSHRLSPSSPRDFSCHLVVKVCVCYSGERGLKGEVGGGIKCQAEAGPESWVRGREAWLLLSGRCCSPEAKGASEAAAAAALAHGGAWAAACNKSESPRAPARPLPAKEARGLARVCGCVRARGRRRRGGGWLARLTSLSHAAAAAPRAPETDEVSG